MPEKAEKLEAESEGLQGADIPRMSPGPWYVDNVTEEPIARVIERVRQMGRAGQHEDGSWWSEGHVLSSDALRLADEVERLQRENERLRQLKDELIVNTGFCPCESCEESLLGRQP